MADIYGLFDRDGSLRYVGKANNPSKRLKRHMREHRRQTPLYNWLRKHGQPEMRILESDCADWAASERRIIAEARGAGCKLLNVADGGDEPHCSISVRRGNAKILNDRIKNDPVLRRVCEMKKAIGNGLKRGYVSNATRAKLRVAAAKRPDLFGSWALIKDKAESA